MGGFFGRFTAFLESGEQTQEPHYQWAGGYYCNEHDAGFEFQEAFRNDSCCPWCGGSVSELIYDE